MHFPLEPTDYYQVQMLAVQFKFVIFLAEKRPARYIGELK